MTAPREFPLHPICSPSRTLTPSLQSNHVLPRHPFEQLADGTWRRPYGMPSLRLLLADTSLTAGWVFITDNWHTGEA